MPRRPAGGGAARQKPGRQDDGRADLRLVLLFWLFLLACALAGRLSWALLALWAGLSVLTHAVYWRDKRAAEAGLARTRERTLHLLALAGGWPGALIAQRSLRHKTAKPTFRIVFWLTVLLNCGLVAWLILPQGRLFLTQLGL